MRPPMSQSCQHYPECAGCDRLHISYEKQLQHKQEGVEKRFVGFQELEIRPIIKSPKEQMYRHKVQLPFGHRKIGKKTVLTLGLHNKENVYIIDQKECRIQDADLTTVAAAIRHWARTENVIPYNEKNGSGLLRHIVLRKANASQEILVGIVTNATEIPGRKKLADRLHSYIQQFLCNEKSKAEVVGILQNVNQRNTKVVLGEKETTWYGRHFVKEKIGDLDFQIGLSTFFQVNPFQIKNLYDLVLQELPSDSNVVDAYCGIGTISLYVASKSKKVVGLEENPNSIRSAVGAAKANGIVNVAFTKGKVLRTLQAALNEKSDVVILDPPREGLDPETKKILLNSKIHKILYVSCNPETLLRDAVALTKVFKYTKMTPVDLFPHTSHLESVSVFTR
ncbi:23S rRNA (uracil(1939)-C(5))-methyltransferase RlmD [Leptospira borgpetersenii]|uniref:tRNA (Uracil-5-)-methyltransferase n=2 Tax=Leptospira borgpetersenii TaxID=174 RepID=Q04UT6_LEPBJ|nr:23S rRNA (uracil(1939)-C(5))-methyltransferase RlmD [Leptospira borgpetersenii]EMO63514.1 23S rRNA (uracil-5-)-methyltransferase RumA [Leptospira borgpetersenii serovar Pomona str. 200901868]ABJ75334.1 tRNA (uracil-5-)-methyltransferase [Leptospira borgpetersenii serovar Hardjo-bovis str. JB197]AMX70430.1 RNA methyltransferase [Leptospira borgpetersenii serovar Hardjo]MBE8362795.1 23S rRNA (uracil(1939)-C(5))-methyltransferase RlmD [Leptospira borgpetersenii serovar Balcanica]MBE8366557.1 2